MFDHLRIEEVPPQDIKIEVWDVIPEKMGASFHGTVSSGWMSAPVTLRCLRHEGNWEMLPTLSQMPFELVSTLEKFWAQHAPLDVKVGDVFTFPAQLGVSLAVDPGWLNPKTGKLYGRVYLHRGHSSIGRMLSLSPNGHVGFGKIPRYKVREPATDERAALRDLKQSVKKHLPEIQSYWASVP